MKNGNGLKKACAILLIASLLFGLTETLATNANNSSTISEAKIIAEDSTKLNKQKLEGPKQSAYRMDGSTSASKLVAKRSHSVSEKDEAGLSIFLGIIVIGVIVFFLKPFSEKK